MNPFYRRAAPGWLCLLAACRSFPSPYTAADLQREAGAQAGDELVHYLGQRGADGWVCAPGLSVPESFTSQDFETFVVGLEHGDVPPDRWSSCARRLLGGLHGATLDHAVRELATRFAASLDARDNEPQRLLVLNALAEALESRPVATARVDKVAAAIGDELARRPLAVEARALATYVHEGLEMSLGRFRGRPVDEESLAAVSDASALRRLARHLPTPTDRRAARARFLDLTVAASSSEWVRTHPAESRAQVLRTGRNALDLSRFPIMHASCAQTASAGTVVVEQNLQAQTARLLMRLMEETSLVPAITVRGSLSLTLAGVHGPVTLCEPAEALDVAPCVDAASFEVASPFTTFDDEGSLHLREELTAEELASLLARGGRLGITLKHGATQLPISHWPLRVLPPDAVVYGDGEPLSVTVARHGSRIAVSFGIHDGPRSLAFVEESDLGDFRSSRAAPRVPLERAARRAPRAPQALVARAPHARRGRVGMAVPGAMADEADAVVMAGLAAGAVTFTSRSSARRPATSCSASRALSCARRAAPAGPEEKGEAAVAVEVGAKGARARRASPARSGRARAQRRRTCSRAAEAPTAPPAPPARTVDKAPRESLAA